MPGVLDLLSWILPNDPSSTEQIDPNDEDIVNLVQHARGETVTPELLTNQNGRSSRPIYEYLEENEQPEYAFRGGQLLLEDETETLGRKHPSREMLLVISNQRVLIVLGGQLSDDLWEIPLEDVVDVYINSMEVKRYVVVEGETDSNPMTFFADVTVESNTNELKAGVEYIAEYL